MNVASASIKLGLLTVWTLSACGGDGTDTGGGGGSKQASGATGDSSGGAGGHSPTSSASSTSSETSLLETVRTLDYSSRAPVAGVVVLSHDADGHIIEQKTTESNGEAQLDVPSGGDVMAVSSYTVTSMNQVSTYHQLQMVKDVPDGALIVLPSYYGSAQPEPIPEHDPMGTITIQSFGFPPGTAQWRAALSCSGGAGALPAQTTATVMNYKGCAGQDSFNISVLALDVDGRILGFGRSASLPFVPGQALNQTILPQANNLQQVIGRIQNVPSGASRANIDIQGYDDLGNTARVYVDKSPPPPGDLDFDSMFPPNSFLNNWHESAYVELSESMGMSRSLTNPISPLTPFELDYAAFPKPHTPVETINDPSHIAISWDVDGGAVADASTIYEDWGRDFEETDWTVYAAPGAGQVRFPDLPTEDADWLLQPGDYIRGASVSQVQDSMFNGYADWLSGTQRGVDVVTSWAVHDPF